MVYCKSDGLWNAMRFVWKSVTSPIYKKSETIFYMFNEQVCSNKGDMQIREVSLEELERMDFPRLKSVNYREWIRNRSRVFVCSHDSSPIAFTWSHYGNYQIHGTGRFLLNKNECWLGPTFVDKRYRGQGINKAQIIFQMNHSNARVYYTSVNKSNIPSCKSFEHLGFRQIGLVRQTTRLGRSVSIIEGNEDFLCRFTKQ